jgi:hypothetical protein
LAEEDIYDIPRATPAEIRTDSVRIEEICKWAGDDEEYQQICKFLV